MAKVKAESEVKDPMEDLKASLDKEYGKGTIMGASDKGTYKDVVSTGSLGLDVALGIGGLPMGRLVEIYGPESSGKTTLALHIIAEVQKKGGVGLIIDAEHAMDLRYAEQLGVNLDSKKLLFNQPDWGEQGLDIACKVIASGLVNVVLIDSVAALTPKKEIDGDMGDSSMGTQARMMGQAMRKLTSIASKHNVLVIFINQIREKIGVMFGSPETTTGGNALKFYASVRLDIRKVLTNKEGEDSVSNTVKVTVKKNKMAPPFKTCNFRIGFGVGIESTREVMDMAVDFNIIQKSGSWFAYDQNKLGQGADAVLALLENNPELFAEIKTKVTDKLKADKDYIKTDLKAEAEELSLEEVLKPTENAI